jgi:hypothetical protein
MADQEEQARKTMEEQTKKMGSVIAKCWSDDDFKKKLLADPAATLKAEGVKFELPAGMTLKVVENTDKVFHLMLPAQPSSDELSEEDLSHVAGGFRCEHCMCGDSRCWDPNCVAGCLTFGACVPRCAVKL